MKKSILFSFLTCFYLFCSAQDINENDLRRHIGYLASDQLKGREPGTKGEKLAYRYIEKEFRSYGLKPIGEKGYLQHFSYHVMSSPHDTIGKGKKKRGTNVIGFLDNGKPYTLVIGGHFDHLGNHEHSSSLDKDKQKGVIHNGADDNASGSAGVLALAKYFAENSVTEQTNFIFICFSGEEDGLIGSKYFTIHPTYDLAKISCMINMDMIGRLSDSTHKLIVYGVGTSPGYTGIFNSINTEFKLVFDSSGIGPSDQTSFYLKNIPVLHFFTGQHSDYHKSTDDAEKINFEGEKRVLSFIAEVCMKLSREPQLNFTPTRANDQQKVSFKVTLGLMPDYTFEGKGMRIDAVTEGKPASIAGLKSGDVIVKMSDQQVDNVYAYMKVLAMFKKGDSTDVEVLRNKETVRVRVTF